MSSKVIGTKISEFDFDDWSALAKTDAEQFTLRRDCAIRQQIQNSANASRSQSLQMMIDESRYSEGLGVRACQNVLQQSIDTLVYLEQATSKLANLINTLPE